MLDLLKKKWSISVPGLGAFGLLGYWGWENYAIAQGGNPVTQFSLYFGIFFLGCFFGALWGDQARPGSASREWLAYRKVIQPALQIIRANPIPLPPTDQNFRYNIEVAISTDRFKDFSNVSANFTVRRPDGAEIWKAPFVEGENINRHVLRRKPIIQLLCPLDKDEVQFIFLDDTQGQVHSLGRGQSLVVAVEVTARSMRPQFRQFSIGVRPDASGRIFYWSNDGRCLVTSF